MCAPAAPFTTDFSLINKWIWQIKCPFSLVVIAQLCLLWERIQRQTLELFDACDVFRWIWTEPGSCSMRTAYRAFFYSLTCMPGVSEVWSSRIPFQLKFFGWLALKNRC